jgi:anti-anti-sigma factor
VTTPATSVAPHFVVDTRRSGTTEVVEVRGEVDIATAPLLRAVLDTVVGRRPTRVEVDLSGTTFMDAQALTTLSAVRRRLASRHATLVVRRPSPVVERLLELTGAEHSFEIVTGSAAGTPGRLTTAGRCYGGAGRPVHLIVHRDGAAS